MRYRDYAYERKNRGILGSGVFYTVRVELADHVSLHFDNNTSMAALFLDIEKAFDTT
jgi:hypothetical protein